MGVGFHHFNHQDYLPLQLAYKINKIWIQKVTIENLSSLQDGEHAFAAHATLQPMQKVKIILGLSVVSDDLEFPQGDKYPKGNRFDISFSFDLPYGFELGGFFSDEFKDLHDGDQIRAEVTLNWDILKVLDEFKEANQD